MLPNVGFGELLLIFTVGLILFGGDRLPKIARGLGEALKAFKDELTAVNPRRMLDDLERKADEDTVGKEDEPRKPSGV